jgi:hypothetical protein
LRTVWEREIRPRKRRFSGISLSFRRKPLNPIDHATKPEAGTRAIQGRDHASVFVIEDVWPICLPSDEENNGTMKSLQVLAMIQLHNATAIFDVTEQPSGRKETRAVYSLITSRKDRDPH